MKRINGWFLYFILFVFIGLIGAKDEDNWQKLLKDGLNKINRAIAIVSQQYQKTKDIRFLIKKANILLELGREQEVIDLLKDKKLDYEGLKLMAEAYYRQKDYTSAMAIWDRLKDKMIEKGDWRAIYLYAKTQEALNLYPKASQLFSIIPVSSSYYNLAQKELTYIDQRADQRSLSKLFSDDIVKKIKQASSQNYPQASAVIIKSDFYTKVLKDNKVYQKVYCLLKVLNDRGKEKFGEIVINYDSTYEKVKLVFARTISPSGRVTSVGKKHIRDVSLYKNFPLYSNARAKIVSMPELVNGSLIEYEFEIIDNKMLADKHLVYYIIPQGDEPVMELNDELVYPEGKLHFISRDVGMQYLSFSADFSPKRTVEDGEVHLKWHFENVPQLIPEPDMPSMMNVTPIRILSSFKNWEQIYNWWWPLAKDKVKPTDRIKQKVKELIKGAANQKEIAERIYYYCAKEIRYVAVEYGKAGYEPHSAQEIFENKYGDCKDQAILLVTMLRYAGLKAYPVIIPTRQLINLDKDFPVVLFNHAIAVVKLGDSWVFMDPTAQTCSFGDLPVSDQGRGVLIFTDSGLIIKETPITDVYQNKIEVTTELDFYKNKTIGNRTVLATGFFAQGQRYWLKFTMPIQIKQALVSKVKSIISDAKLIDYKVENLDIMDQPVVLRYSFLGKNDVLISAGKYKLLPMFETISLEDVVKDKRRYPIEKDGLSTSSYIYKFKFPGKIKVLYMPKPVEVDTPWFKAELRYFIEQDDNSVVEFFKYVNKVLFISPKDYLSYKKAKVSLVNKLKERLLLQQD